MSKFSLKIYIDSNGNVEKYEPALFKAPLNSELVFEIIDERSMPLTPSLSDNTNSTQRSRSSASSSLFILTNYPREENRKDTSTSSSLFSSFTVLSSTNETLTMHCAGGGFAIWATTSRDARPDASQGFERFFKGSAAFCVLPEQLMPESNGGPLSLNAICMQTVVSRCLGPLSRWSASLKPTLQSGFNAIHFTPLLERGSSNSSYSLLSHVVLANDFFLEREGTAASGTAAAFPVFVSPSQRFERLQKFTRHLEQRERVLCVGDLVLNHVASNSPFLMAHGLDAAFTPANTPGLEVAVVVDEALTDLSRALDREEVLLLTAADIDEAVLRLRKEFLPVKRLWEFYTIHVDDTMEQLSSLVSPNASEGDVDWLSLIKSLLVKRDLSQGKDQRFPWCVDQEALARVTHRLRSTDQLRSLLDQINIVYFTEYDDDVDAICSNVSNHAKHMRLDPAGPLLPAGVSVERDAPLVTPYFVHTAQLPEKLAREADEIEARDPFHSPNPYMEAFKRYDVEKKTVNAAAAAAALPTMPLACNGWLWGASPGYRDEDVCSINCRAYRRREMIIWGDTVKVRYGRQASDSPYAWKRAEVYGETMAQLFSGLRLDNAHSTPLAVAIHCLSAARRHCPSLWIAAEWFSGDQHADAVATAALGAAALVREAAAADNGFTMAKYCWENGKREEQEEEEIMMSNAGKKVIANVEGAELALAKALMLSSTATASVSAAALPPRFSGPPLLPFLRPLPLFCDMTHDNQSAIERTGSPAHFLASAALVAAAATGALGSVRGADELTPKLRHLVAIKTPPLYSLATSDSIGIRSARPLFNFVHKLLALPEFAAKTEVFANDSIVTVTRRRSDGEGALVAVAHCSFSPSSAAQQPGMSLPHFLNGESSVELIGAGSLDVSEEAITRSIVISRSIHSRSLHAESQSKEHVLPDGPMDKFHFASAIDTTGDDIRHQWQSRRQVDDAEARQFLASVSESGEVINFGPLFRPGSFLFLYTSSKKRQAGSTSSLPSEASSNFHRLLSDMKTLCEESNRGKAKEGKMDRGENSLQALHQSIDSLELIDFNHLLYTCGEEEWNRLQQRPYSFDGEHSPVYAGLCGLAHSALFHGSLVQSHLRRGDWLWSFVINRAGGAKGSLKGVAARLYEEHFSAHRQHLDTFCWFLVLLIYALQHRLNALFNVDERMLSSPQALVHSLLYRGTVQNFGLAGARRRFGSLAAGLPHFSSGWSRQWGRDTMMSLRGLLMRTGQWIECLRVIKRFGSVVRHGLIPNLLEGGHGGDEPRYNARDAAWWWLLAVRDFARLAPKPLADALFVEEVQLRFVHSDHDNDLSLLQQWQPEERERSRLVQDDDVPAAAAGQGPLTTIAGVVQLILQSHALGIDFRERGAGSQLDMRMQDQGFNVRAYLQPETGLIFGGNRFNAGTWMDKMGESDTAGNSGWPATPRDGAAVEINAICFTVVDWLRRSKDYPWKAVQCASSGAGAGADKLSFAEWASRMKEHFESRFYVPLKDDEEYERFAIDEKLVHRRGMLKDTVGASESFRDYQLRSNALVALAEAPELLRADRARAVLRLSERVLVTPGSMGVKTLDPSDWQYRGDYDQAYDGDDASRARGFNYHQGPEWLWPYGNFLLAKRRVEGASREEAMDLLRAHLKYLMNGKENQWLGLPELTNAGGKPCYFSCPTQAWSFATILDAIKE